MQKLFNVQQIRTWDETTIRNEPIQSVDLMERAAARCAEWIRTNYVPVETPVLVIAGTGNNGGDGLVIARLLHEKRFNVRVAICGDAEKGSSDFKINLERLQSIDLPVAAILQSDDLPLLELDKEPIVIDALFGSGLSRPVEGWRADLIAHINGTGVEVISIDLPSGLPADPPELGFNRQGILRADVTLTFQQPKISCLYDPWGEYCGEVVVIDIGLDAHYETETHTNTYLLERSDIVRYLPDRQRFSHKGTFGKLLIAAGSRGMMGAAVLTTRAALRSGVGLVLTHTPKCGVDIVQTQAPEAMVQPDSESDFVSTPRLDDKVTAVAGGPGLGTSSLTAKAVDALLQMRDVPMVLDADALNQIATRKTQLAAAEQHKGLVLTPHPGEFDRLFGKHEDERSRVQTAREAAAKWEAVIVLKGAYTKVILPDGKLIINPTGSPAMATGGSGDVLTGLIGGLLAQGLHREEAALTGVFLHGYTGQLYERRYGQRGLTAGWLADHLPEGWKELMEED